MEMTQAVHPQSRMLSAGLTRCRKTDGGQELVLTLSGPEMSDYLNFVIKDKSTGRW